MHLPKTLLVLVLGLIALCATASAVAARTYSDAKSGFEYYFT